MEKKNKIKIIFIGTSDFGLPSFKILLNSDEFDIISVITQPDKKVGRKQKIIFSPIKQEALKSKIPLLQPKKIISSLGTIKKLNPDLILVIAYGQIIPEEIFNLPKHKSLNMHGSLLPKYRGAACIQAPIINNDKYTGITIIQINKGLDTGPILEQAKLEIKNNENFETLHNKLSELGAKILIPVLKKYTNNEIQLKPQDNKKASYVKQLKKQDGKINFNQDGKIIERFIRAMTPWPGAFSYTNDKKMIKILKVENKPIKINKYKIGKLFLINNNLAVQSKINSLIIKKIQPEAKKPMTAQEFIRGYQKYINTILS